MGLTPFPSFLVAPSRGVEPPSSFPGGFGRPARFCHQTSRSSLRLKGNFPTPPLLRGGPAAPSASGCYSFQMLPLGRGCLEAFDPLKFQLRPWLRAGSLPLLLPSLSASILGWLCWPGAPPPPAEDERGEGQEIRRTSGTS